MTEVATYYEDVAAAPAPAPAARRRRRGAGFWVYLGVATSLAVVFVLPIIWAILRSFQPARLSSLAPQSADFTQMTFSNYRAVSHGQYDILPNLLNSVIVGLGTALLTTVVATLAGYGLAKFRFRGSGIVFGIILLALMIPFQAVLTPLYLELSDLHLTNNLLGLILVYSTFNLPFGVFVMRNTFQQVPQELVESARVDGAGFMFTLVRVMRPLIVPGLATCAMYAFLYAWTELLQAVTFVQSPEKLTLPAKLYEVTTSTYGSINNAYLSAGVVIAMVPCVILYFALQRYYVQGMMSGAVKG
ncbi:MAG TPA: carbohydrate ABC transporter permease [Solirubrobacteraceae bacterium]|jgi:multiple sugar transport system permease protein